MSITSKKYFSEIDTLRAIAVISVILGHIDYKFLSGGFLGVDIFFIISGFVVTASICKRLENKEKKFFRNFYIARFKRLYPSLLICIGLFLIPSLFLLSDTKEMVLSGLFSTLGMSNLFFAIRATDYFSFISAANPFTHTWSLGVEEQFYLFFPLLLYFLSKRKVFVLALLSFLSLIFLVLSKNVHEMYAFYLMPGRFFQFAFGAMAYLANTKKIQKINKNAIWLPFLGLLCCLVLTKKFSLNALILTTLFSSLILVFIKEKKDQYPILKLSPMLFLGKISYSLYLVHWPLVVLLKQTISLDYVPVLLFYLVSVLGLSVLSFYWIENRYRKRIWSPIFKASIGIIFVGLISSSFFIPSFAKLFIGNHKENYGNISGPVSMKKNCEVHSEVSSLDKLKNNLTKKINEKCTIGEGDERLFLIGNSHALEKFELFKKYAEDHDKRFSFFSIMGIAFYPYDVEGVRIDHDRLNKKENKEYALALLESVYEIAKANDIIVLSSPIYHFNEGYYQFYDAGGKKMKSFDAFEIFIFFLKASQVKFQNKGAKLIYIDSYPLLVKEIPPHNCYQPWSHLNPLCQKDRIINKEDSEQIQRLDKRLSMGSEVNFISMFDMFLEAFRKEKYPAKLYDNYEHMSVWGNEYFYEEVSARLGDLLNVDNG